MDCLRKYLIILFFICFPLLTKSTVKEKYDKHVIIVVDQTLTNDNMLLVYDKLCCLLKNQETGLDKNLYDIPDDFHFNPNTDEISIFGFAFPRNVYDYINRQHKSTNAKVLFDEFSKSLIGDGCSYQKSNKDLNNFLKPYFRNTII